MGKTTRPFRYDLNQIPYDYTVEVRNRFKGLDLIDKMHDELWNEEAEAFAGVQRRDYGAWSKVMTVESSGGMFMFKTDSRTQYVRNQFKGMRETEEPG